MTEVRTSLFLILYETWPFLIVNVLCCVALSIINTYSDVRDPSDADVELNTFSLVPVLSDNDTVKPLPVPSPLIAHEAAVTNAMHTWLVHL